MTVLDAVVAAVTAYHLAARRGRAPGPNESL